MTSELRKGTDNVDMDAVKVSLGQCERVERSNDEAVELAHKQAEQVLPKWRYLCRCHAR